MKFVKVNSLFCVIELVQFLEFIIGVLETGTAFFKCLDLAVNFI